MWVAVYVSHKIILLWHFGYLGEIIVLQKDTIYITIVR